MFYPDAKGTDIPTAIGSAPRGLRPGRYALGRHGLTWDPTAGSMAARQHHHSRVTRPGSILQFPGVYHEGCMVWRYHPEKKIYESSPRRRNTFGSTSTPKDASTPAHGASPTASTSSRRCLSQARSRCRQFGPPVNPYSFGTLAPMFSRNPIPRFTHDIIMFEGTASRRLCRQDDRRRPAASFADGLRALRIGSTFETSDSGRRSRPTTSFRPVYLSNAPDGALYIADFCEEFIAHGQTTRPDRPHHRRIYRLRGKNMPLNKDVTWPSDDGQLVETCPTLIAGIGRPPCACCRAQRSRRNRGAQGVAANEQTHPALEALLALYQLAH